VVGAKDALMFDLVSSMSNFIWACNDGWHNDISVSKSCFN